ncbi:ATP-grasp domain-containing protein [Enterococcus sp. BWB1-3]|uniref:ATP-grasp domain-containing protein n=1 Tax=Enterococcus sp. BWB1-3 TaxID=2787713 RepID=UPI001924238D|nr:ATP-grasp domain-containing protein [Enterococcus sp. BWB1-3]MBL1229169.1 ATP-grasp domain-containing protein [Enterococcus sp. BWB1-3]
MISHYLFLFPADPLDTSLPDEDYKKEYDAAKQYFNVALLQLEPLMESNKVKLSRLLTENEIIVYRGWMLTPCQYDQLQQAVEQQGASMLTALSEYKNTHLLPSWAGMPHMLQTNWTESLSETALINLLSHFSGAVTVKDFVKSRKHEWHDAFFVPDVSDTTQALKVINTFIERQEKNLMGGIVLREFVELMKIGEHPKSYTPIFEEYRVFYWLNEPIALIDYWHNDSVQLSEEEERFIKQQGKKIHSPFFTVDYARKTTGKLIIIEIGDGQVSGLQEHDEEFFYAELSKRHKFYKD